MEMFRLWLLVLLVLAERIHRNENTRILPIVLFEPTNRTDGGNFLDSTFVTTVDDTYTQTPESLEPSTYQYMKHVPIYCDDTADDIVKCMTTQSTDRTLPPEQGLMSAMMFMEFSGPAFYMIVILAIFSAVVNCLNIVVHRKKTMTLATVLLAMSVSEMGESIVIIFVQFSEVFPFTEDPNFPVSINILINRVIGGYFMISFKRISQCMTALICLDRFLVLSGAIQKTTMIQKHPNMAVGIVLLAMFSCTTFESYNVYTDEKRAASLIKSIFSVIHEYNMATADPVNSPSILTTEAMTLMSVQAIYNLSLTEGTTSLSLTEIPTAIPSTSKILEDFFRAMAMLSKGSMYAVLIVMIILNIATFVFLKQQAVARRQLGISTSEAKVKMEQRRQSVILVTTTTVYVILALPVTSVTLLTDLQLPGFNFGSKDKFLLLALIKCSFMCELVKNASDFVVFMCMSRSYRKTLLTSLCPST